MLVHACVRCGHLSSAAFIHQMSYHAIHPSIQAKAREEAWKAGVGRSKGEKEGIDETEAADDVERENAYVPFYTHTYRDVDGVNLMNAKNDG